MKMMFYTDVHLSGQTPVHRTDDYPKTMLDKLREVYEIADRAECDIAICGGDLFNSMKVYSYDVLNGVMDIIGGFPIKTFTISGQHELMGYNRSKHDSSALGLMVRCCEQLSLIPDGGVFLDSDYHLMASHAWDDVEEKVAAWEPVDGRVGILVAHALLSRDTHMFEVIQTSKLPPTKFRLILSGDLHDGYPTHSIGKTTFCNPGALARPSMSEMDRHPQVAIVTISDKGERLSVDLVKLKTAKPAEEVFGMTLVEELREVIEFDAKRFIKEVSELKGQRVDVFDLVRSVAKRTDVPKEVVAYILSKKRQTA